MRNIISNQSGVKPVWTGTLLPFVGLQVDMLQTLQHSPRPIKVITIESETCKEQVELSLLFWSSETSQAQLVSWIPSLLNPQCSFSLWQHFSSASRFFWLCSWGLWALSVSNACPRWTWANAVTPGHIGSDSRLCSPLFSPLSCVSVRSGQRSWTEQPAAPQSICT